MTNSEFPAPGIHTKESLSGEYSILVVDDEALVRWSVAQVLRKANHRVTTADTGEEAILYLNSANQDIIITDMKLPGSDGFSLAAAAKKANPACHIIMMTAFGDVASKDRAKDIGIEHFIDKPVNLGELVWLVHRVMK
jgi:two-component system response regulator (stage 0 sporulation protein F)